MRRILLLAVILLLFTAPVKASVMEIQEESLDLETIERNLPQTADRVLQKGHLDAAQDPAGTLYRILKEAWRDQSGSIRSALKSMFQVLSTAMLCKILSSLSVRGIDQIAAASGMIGIMLLCSGEVTSMIGLGRMAMEDIKAFSGMLLPVMASVSVGAGAVTSSPAIYLVTVFFFYLLVGICSHLLMPLLSVYLALAATECLLTNTGLKELRTLIGWTIKTGIKTVMYVFTGFLALTGVLTGAADASAIQAVKLTVSGMVPVVGGIISDAVGTVLGSAGLLRNSIGIWGALVFVSLFFTPFLRIGICLMGFRFTSCLCGLIDSRFEACLSSLADAMRYILAMIAGCSLMNLLACFSLMKAAGVG